MTWLIASNLLMCVLPVEGDNAPYGFETVSQLDRELGKEGMGESLGRFRHIEIFVSFSFILSGCLILRFFLFARTMRTV